MPVQLVHGLLEVRHFQHVHVHDVLVQMSAHVHVVRHTLHELAHMHYQVLVDDIHLACLLDSHTGSKGRKSTMGRQAVSWADGVQAGW